MIATLRRSQGKLISSLFLSVGIFLLIQVIAPLVSFEVWAIGQKINSRTLVSPVKSSEQIPGVSVQDRNNFPAFISSLKRETQPNYDRFSLSIPKLKIERQDVLVDTNYLSENLAHLSGSALPGEKGNVFISGHSALSQFSVIKSVPFSKLPELKKGDQIIVETSGSEFIYEVSDFKVVDPTDLSVVEAPETQGRYISLMTCVPPGLNLKRLVVLGKMI
ncbi:MAG: class E sortase [Candidatus Daviesbacteria bacterium]|nr:class E sortase [Candidatus Daviesbacteria bacterium]